MFEQVPDAVVPIRGLRDLRDYLTDHITTWNGMKVRDFVAFGQMMFIRTEYQGKILRNFYAYVDDAAYNVQKGFYEKEPQ